MLDKFLGRYFLCFVGVYVTMTTLMALRWIDQAIGQGIINTALLSFFGGGAINSIATAITAWKGPGETKQ